MKSKFIKRFCNFEEEKSSPDSASDYKPYDTETISTSPSANVVSENSYLSTKCATTKEDQQESCKGKRTYKSGKPLSFQ